MLRRIFRAFSPAPTPPKPITDVQLHLGPGRTYNNRYKVLSQLGEGRHATVWLAEDIQNAGTRMAIKVLSTYITSLQGTDAFELDVLDRIAVAAPENKHLLHLLDRFTITADHGTHTCLVTKALADKSLQDLARAAPDRKLPARFVRHVSRHLLDALAALHDDCHVVHTDIKPDNILFDAAHLDPATADAEILAGKADAVLVDVGTALPLSKPRRFPVQPVALRAPEVLLGWEWDTKIDIWNTGCLIFELLTGRLLFDPQPYESFSADQYHYARIRSISAEDPSALARVFRTGKFYGDFYDGDGETMLNASPDSLERIVRMYGVGEDVLADFLSSMLRIDPHTRASARQLRLHPWLSVP